MNIQPQQMETFVASRLADRLGGNEQLLERILERRNVLSAINQVIANKDAPGVDGMTATQLKEGLRGHPRLHGFNENLENREASPRFPTRMGRRRKRKLRAELVGRLLRFRIHLINPGCGSPKLENSFISPPM